MNRNNRGPTALWQVALYIAVLGFVSMLLAPLTAGWWIVPLLGAAVPLLLAVIQTREHRGSVADPASVAAQVTAPAAEDGPVLPESTALPALAAAGTSATAESASAARPTALDVALSEREREVLALLATGQTNAEVAGALFISVGTVKSHSANIYRKLEAKNRTEAVARARELDLLP